MRNNAMQFTLDDIDSIARYGALSIERKTNPADRAIQFNWSIGRMHTKYREFVDANRAVEFRSELDYAAQYLASAIVKLSAEYAKYPA